MTAANDIHFVLAFLVALSVLVFSWNTLGRRVVNVVLGLQLLAGLALVGVHVAGREPLPQGASFHIGATIAALLCYGLALRAGKRPGGSGTALALSIAGLACVAVTLYLGMRMYLTAAP